MEPDIPSRSRNIKNVHASQVRGAWARLRAWHRTALASWKDRPFDAAFPLGPQAERKLNFLIRKAMWTKATKPLPPDLFGVEASPVHSFVEWQPGTYSESFSRCSTNQPCFPKSPGS